MIKNEEVLLMILFIFILIKQNFWTFLVPKWARNCFESIILALGTFSNYNIRNFLLSGCIIYFYLFVSFYWKYFMYYLYLIFQIFWYIFICSRRDFLSSIFSTENIFNIFPWSLTFISILFILVLKKKCFKVHLRWLNVVYSI